MNSAEVSMADLLMVVLGVTHVLVPRVRRHAAGGLALVLAAALLLTSGGLL
jgi:hypothetical protein